MRIAIAALFFATRLACAAEAPAYSQATVQLPDGSSLTQQCPVDQKVKPVPYKLTIQSNGAPQYTEVQVRPGCPVGMTSGTSDAPVYVVLLFPSESTSQIRMIYQDSRQHVKFDETFSISPETYASKNWGGYHVTLERLH